MSPPALPPLAPVTVSASTRLAYVLRHFALAYPAAPSVSIGYASSHPQVELVEISKGFFEGINPYPAAPTYREWLGQTIPFFFDNPAEKNLLIFTNNKVLITADIISAAFYLLSGWQEYFLVERDRYGRFPYAASVQQQYNFVTLPVVNYYFDVLKTAIEYVSGQALQPRRWGSQQAEFAAFISHDIDNLHSAWKAPAKLALQQGRLLHFGQLLWQHQSQPDAWDNLEAVAEATAQYGAQSTFFILPSFGKAANGTLNADYTLTPQLRQRLRKLQEVGCELALHGSIGTATDQNNLDAELQKIPAAAGLGIRFHYLSWEPQQTLTVVEKIGFEYDSTLGFAEHYGFRHSYCLPFYPFNFASERAADFLEIPLNVMDATLYHPNYLQVAPAKTLAALAPIFAEIKRFGGVASVLWHNENFDPANTKNGPQQFHEIMAHLQQQGAVFCTGRKIWQEFTTAKLITNS